MADVPAPLLARAREQKIEELAAHFANDDISIEDLERRIELVYKASSVAELESITEDLRRAMMTPPPASHAVPVNARTDRPAAPLEVTPYELASTRMLALMSSTKRVGRWALPRKLDLLAIMSDTKIDLRDAVLVPGTSEINIRAVMSSVKVVVPPGVPVVVDTQSIMGDIASRADSVMSDVATRPGTPIIRLTGFAFMAEVKVKMRTRGAAPGDGEEDDEEK